jgi:hypothetical protein
VNNIIILGKRVTPDIKRKLEEIDEDLLNGHKKNSYLSEREKILSQNVVLVYDLTDKNAPKLEYHLLLTEELKIIIYFVLNNTMIFPNKKILKVISYSLF